MSPIKNQICCHKNKELNLKWKENAIMPRQELNDSVQDVFRQSIRYHIDSMQFSWNNIYTGGTTLEEQHKVKYTRVTQRSASGDWPLIHTFPVQQITTGYIHSHSSVIYL